MKIPKFVHILGRKIVVKQKTKLKHHGKPVYGLADLDDRVIWLERKQSPMSKYNTLIHEVAHQFLCISGIDQKLSESETEMYCQLLLLFGSDVKKIEDDCTG
jgi:hypothetical protein